ncbi:MAG: hypothetical protein AB7V39_08375 [Nitrospiraceae bacterium]
MDVIQRLQQDVPVNEYGLPNLIYDPQHIPADYFNLSLVEQAEIISLAAVPIDYAEGFPTLDGTMIWETLPFESAEAVTALREYLKLSDTYGYRSLQLLTDTLYPATTQPSKDTLEAALRKFREFYVYFSWNFRTRAFDMLHHVAYMRVRERRAIETENYHFIQVQKILTPLISRFGRFRAEDWDKLEPEAAIKALKELAQLQRVAAGLPAHGPQIPTARGQDEFGSSVEQRLKAIAQKNPQDQQQAGTLSETERALTEDPTTLAMAQELVMRMSKRMTPESDQGTAAGRPHTTPESEAEEDLNP